MAGSFAGRVGRSVLVLVAVSLFEGCDGTSHLPRPSLASCTSGWIPTSLSLEKALGPRAMVWANGVLYQSWTDVPTIGEAIVSTPADGGSVTTLVPNDWANGIWVEGDNVLYAHDDRLMQVPITGGSPTAILDGGQAGAASTPPTYFGTSLLDPSWFYWATSNETGVSQVWRMPRSGGAPEALAPLPLQNVSNLVALSDGVLVEGTQPLGAGGTWNALVAPFGGGNPQPLDPIGYQFVSVDSGGAIWTAFTGAPDALDETFQVRISPADGSPATPLSPELPIGFLADWGSPDGQGGRLLSGNEIFDDLLIHREVFLVGADGSATRLACNPSNDVTYLGAGAVSPDALYMTVNDPNGWVIVKVPRVAP